MPSTKLPKGLPRRFSKAPFWGRTQKFPWDHSLPGTAQGGIQYIPSLGVMVTTAGIGEVQFRDPVTAEVLYEFLFDAVANGLKNSVYVPSANVLAVASYSAGNGTNVIFVDLNNGEATWVGAAGMGTYGVDYCPITDRVYTVSYQANAASCFNPWTKTLVTHITGLGGVSLTPAYCPLNGKLYIPSRTANNVSRIDVLTNTIDSTFASGASYDIAFYSDGMRKMIMSSATTNAGWKTIDPLAGDALNLISGGGTALAGTFIPKTGETVVHDTNGNMKFFDQAGTNTANLIIAAAIRFVGWNPITETLWCLDEVARQLFIVDPVQKSGNVQAHAVTRTQ